MSSLKSMQLLYNIAIAIENERESFSRIEIVSKINKIKYLSEQKGVPRFVIKKEVIHLESMLEHIFEIETVLKQRKSRESQKISVLKRQIAQLKKQLVVCDDKEVTGRITKLSYLLGDMLAKCGSAEEVEVCQQLLKEMNVKTHLPKVLPKSEITETTTTCMVNSNVTPIKTLSEDEQKHLDELKAADNQKLMHIQSKLAELKLTLELAKTDAKNKELIKLLEEKISMIEAKLSSFGLSNVVMETELPSMGPSPLLGIGRHDVLFDSGPHFSNSAETISVSTTTFSGETTGSNEIVGEAEELPYPPPPRVKKEMF